MTEIQLIKEYIKKNGELKTFTTGQLMISAGKEANSCFLLDQGEARLIYKVNNKRTTLKKFYSGDLIGISSLITGKTTDEVRASNSTTTYVINKEDFRNLILKDKKLNTFFEKYLFDEEIGLVLQGLINKSAESENNLKLIFENLIHSCTLLNSKKM